MFTLFILATSTAIGDFSSLTACQAAIRQIYTQKADPYRIMPAVELKKLIDSQMRYNAPKDYVCIKRG